MRSPRLVSADRGRIAHLLLSLPASAPPGHTEAAIAAAALVPRLTIVTDAAGEAAVRRALASHRGEAANDVIVTPPGTTPTLWAQDALVAYETAGARPIVAPSSPAGAPSPARTLFEALAAAGLIEPVWPDGLPLRGGNLIAAGETLLVGADEWRRWRAIATTAGAPDPDAAASGFLREHIDAARKIVIVGGGLERSPGPSRFVIDADGIRWRENVHPCVVERRSLQALYHLDLYLLPLGPDPAAGRPRLMVGALEDAATDPALAASLDRVAADLAAEGFAVGRLPIAIETDVDAVHHRRTHYVTSSLNGWTETADAVTGTVIVTLSRFGEKSAVDAATGRALAALGVTARAFAGGRPLARMAGGLNCVSKVLARH